jgi:hypothetical protein
MGFHLHVEAAKASENAHSSGDPIGRTYLLHFLQSLLAMFIA